MVHQVFSAWSNFYVMTGSSSAALTGLVFVVITLAAGRRDRPTTMEGTSVFTSPTVVHFCAAFLISGIFAAPWPSPGLAGTAIGLTGLFGVLLLTRVTYRAWRIATYRADLGDWIWFIALPTLAYFMLLVAGFALVHMPAQSSFVIGAATLLLIFVGIHNAWDVVTYLVIDKTQE
jgi:hypothetical protein